MNATTQAEHEVLELISTKVPEEQVAVQQHGALEANSPAGMMMAALAQGASLEQFEKMMDLQERWERREAEKAYNAAFAAFKAEAIHIVKNRKVTAGPLIGKSYAELHSVVDAITPALSLHGLSASWRLTRDEPQWLEVTCILKHSGGHFETVSMGGPPDAGGAKNAIQARASTKTYLERYTLKAVCGVAEAGEDDDGNGGDGRPTRLETWRALALTCQRTDELSKVYRDATQDFTKAKDVAGYATFAKVATQHGSQLREQEAQKAKAEQRSSEAADHA